MLGRVRTGARRMGAPCWSATASNARNPPSLQVRLCRLDSCHILRHSSCNRTIIRPSRCSLQGMPRTCCSVHSASLVESAASSQPMSTRTSSPVLGSGLRSGGPTRIHIRFDLIYLGYHHIRLFRPIPNDEAILGLGDLLRRCSTTPTMHLMFTLDENGNRIYTLKVR